MRKVIYFKLMALFGYKEPTWEELETVNVMKYGFSEEDAVRVVRAVKELAIRNPRSYEEMRNFMLNTFNPEEMLETIETAEGHTENTDLEYGDALDRVVNGKLAAENFQKSIQRIALGMHTFAEHLKELGRKKGGNE